MNPLLNILNLIKVALNHRFFRNVALLASGTAIGQGIVLIGSPIITRLYTPQDFGVLGVFTSVFSILLAIIVLRYEFAIPLADTIKQTFNLIVLCFLIIFVMCLGCLILSFFIYRLKINVLKLDLLPEPILFLLPFGLLFSGIYQVLSFIEIRNRTFKLLSRSKIGQGAGQTITQIFLGINKSGPLGLILGKIISPIVGISCLLRFDLSKIKNILSEIKIKDIFGVAKRFRRFPLLSSGSVFINRAGMYFPYLLLSSFYGVKVLGWFLLAQRVIGIPLLLIGQSVSQVYIGEISNHLRERPASIKRLFLKTAANLLLVIGIPIVILTIFSPLVFKTIFGEQWEVSGYYLRHLVVLFIFRSVAVPLSSSLNIIERQDLQIIWDSFRLFLSIISLLFAVKLNLSPIYAISIFAHTMAITYLFLFILTWYAISKKLSNYKAGVSS